MKISAYLISAYIALELNEPTKALEYANIIESQNSCADSSTKFIARVYGAQAHALMHEGENSFSFLNKLLLEVSLGSPKGGKMCSLTTEQIYLFNPQIDRRTTINNKLSEKDKNCPEFVTARAVCEIKKGNIQSGLKILNEYVPQEDD